MQARIKGSLMNSMALDGTIESLRRALTGLENTTVLSVEIDMSGEPNSYHTIEDLKRYRTIEITPQEVSTTANQSSSAAAAAAGYAAAAPPPAASAGAPAARPDDRKARLGAAAAVKLTGQRLTHRTEHEKLIIGTTPKARSIKRKPATEPDPKTAETDESGEDEKSTEIGTKSRPSAAAAVPARTKTPIASMRVFNTRVMAITPPPTTRPTHHQPHKKRRNGTDMKFTPVQ
jgi:hypothetical protein